MSSSRRGGDVYGEGVHVAVRLEALADPGGILISDKILREVEGKVEAAFEDRGEQQVKNISRPVHVYAVQQAGSPTATATASLSGRSAFISAPLPGATNSLPLPDKPSIAVLPFQNMSGDPEQEYFADGMVEDITTALSRIKWLFVIARNSSFTYKGKAVDIKQVGRELGVRYVLEGSVRKSRSRTAVLEVDLKNQEIIWGSEFTNAKKNCGRLKHLANGPGVVIGPPRPGDPFDLADIVARAMRERGPERGAALRNPATICRYPVLNWRKL
jgi:adenylate cyclase